MRDSSDNERTLAHILKALKLKRSAAKTPAAFKDSPKETCLILSINRKDLVGIIKGNCRPQQGSTPTTFTTNEPTTVPHTLEQDQSTTYVRQVLA